MNKFEAIKEKIAAIEPDATAFYEKGNKSAGTRLRNGLQEIKVLTKEARDEVTSLKNGNS